MAKMVASQKKKENFTINKSYFKDNKKANQFNDLP